MFLDIAIWSETDFAVRFLLSCTVKKIADRWTLSLSLWAAYPMVGSLIGYGAYCGDSNELCHSFRRSLDPIVSILKYRAQV